MNLTILFAKSVTFEGKGYFAADGMKLNEYLEVECSVFHDHITFIYINIYQYIHLQCLKPTLCKKLIEVYRFMLC